MVGSTRCNRCNSHFGVRRFAVGDITPGGFGTAIPATAPTPGEAADNAAGATTAGADDPGQPDIVDPSTADPEPPDGWEDRIRRLPCQSLIHIPMTCRLRMATAATGLWEGMAAGLPG